MRLSLVNLARLSCVRRGVAPWVKDKGFCEWELCRNFEKGAPKTAINEHMTYWRYYTRVWRGRFEMYPILFCMSAACCFVLAIWYQTLQKPDLHIDRTKKDPPWDWSRLKDGKYLNNHARFYTKSVNWQEELPEIVVATQDKMLEAAHERGTR